MTSPHKDVASMHEAVAQQLLQSKLSARFGYTTM